MVVYVDVLLFINAIINYAILMTTERIMKRDCRLWRMLCGALVGAMFSLVIFIDADSRIFLFLLKLLSSTTISLVTFGWHGGREYMKVCVCNTVVSLLYCGGMILFYQVFHPPNMLIVNDVLYLLLDPLLLIGMTAVIYIILLIVNKLFFERIKSSVVPLRFTVRDQIYSCVAKIDTGCHLQEPFSSAPVIIVDPIIFSINANEPMRIIPYTTIGSSSYLYAVKADRVIINKKPVTKTVYIASGQIHHPNYQAIINSDIVR